MAYLKNCNGEIYHIIGSRKSNTKHPKDYLVKTKKGAYIVAHGWDSKWKCWEQGDFYGWGKEGERLAKKDFYSKKR